MLSAETPSRQYCFYLPSQCRYYAVLSFTTLFLPPPPVLKNCCPPKFQTLASQVISRLEFRSYATSYCILLRLLLPYKKNTYYFQSRTTFLKTFFYFYVEALMLANVTLCKVRINLKPKHFVKHVNSEIICTILNHVILFNMI